MFADGDLWGIVTIERACAVCCPTGHQAQLRVLGSVQGRRWRCKQRSQRACGHCMCLQNKAAAGTTKQVSGAGQTWAAPNSLAQLMDVLKAPSKASGQGQLRIIAGNTGSGPTLCFLGSCNAHNTVSAHNACSIRQGGSALCIRGMSGLCIECRCIQELARQQC